MGVPKNIETLIKNFEGCYLNAYKCPAGVWTIGYGHTKGVYKGMYIDATQAYNLLKEDLLSFRKQLEKRSKYKSCDNKNYKDAMLSFAFNCGCGNFDKLTNNRNWYQVFCNLGEYSKAKVNGKYTKLNGLARRRTEELQYALKFTSEQNTNKYQKSTTTVCQGMLNKWNTSRKINRPTLVLDGCYGHKTRDMVKAFQRYYKYTETGKLDKKSYLQLVKVSFNITTI